MTHFQPSGVGEASSLYLLVREIHTRMPVILPEEHHDAWLSGEAVKEVLVPFPANRVKAWPVCEGKLAQEHTSTAGWSTQKESHVIQKSMEQSGHICSTHSIETYEEIKERFHYLTHQTGDPDVVRV